MEGHSLSFCQRLAFVLAIPAVFAFVLFCIYVYHSADWTHPVTERIFEDGNFAIVAVPAILVCAVGCEGRQMLQAASRACQSVLPTDTRRSAHKD